MITETVSPQLTAEEVTTFKEQGYLGPFPMMSPEEMVALTPDIEAVLESDPFVDTGSGNAPPNASKRRYKREHNRHLDKRVIYSLAAHPEIIGRMVSLYGPDLLLWRTNFFVKYAGSKRIPWHQDFNYWPLEPPVICSAWIAVDPSTVENSCVQVIPGSHRKVIPHVKADEDMVFQEMGDEKYYDANDAVDLEMQPGEFILFNERTLHHSHPNSSDKRRIGLAVRVILPFVTVLRYDSPEHGLPMLHGEDRMGFNKLVAPPGNA
ncbi:MAG: hypothetical protein CME19_19690 [Gemmatimonadetes bacterium]|nr:hypothetical protein [Gemmatimonadota bacterium]